MTPLLQDASGVFYAAAGWDRRPGEGLVLFLPDYGEQVGILHELLSDVLPQVAPHLFPFRHDLAWLKEPDFLHPRVLALQNQKAELDREADRKMEEIDQQIKAIEAAESHVADLLTAAGDRLKTAVNRVITELFAKAGIGDAVIIDVDMDPYLRDGDRNKREDLRIEWAGDVFLLDVAGREQIVRQPSLNQLSQHRRLFLQATQMPGDRVHSLLVANFNYAGGMDPRARGQMFGSGTADAQERLLADGYGVISTFDLYQLIRAVQRHETVLKGETIRKLLGVEGILDYATLLAPIRK